MRFMVLVFACVAACSEPAPAETPPATIQIHPAPPQPQPAGAPQSFVDTDPTPLTREELIGMWSLRENCGQPTIFAADGALTDYTGQSGQWTLEGDTLTIIKAGQTSRNEVNQLNANAFSAGSPDDGGGSTRLFVIYQRC